MCGICLIIGGIKIDSHEFDFNFFESYLCKTTTPLNKHIIDNKLNLSSSINLAQICQSIAKRGPNAIVAHSIDLYKTNYKPITIKEVRKQYAVLEGQALGVQSVLHLRGQSMYIPQTPGSYFLFNGQIWDTGCLTGFQKDQNDSKWLHQTLIQCKGSKQRMIQILQEIRGDYAFILLEDNQIFIGKDYFGKRSLLLGMGSNYLVFSSTPTEHCSKTINDQDKDDQQEDGEVPWKLKYEAEWHASKNKQFFQIPSNSLISITLQNNHTRWSHNKIQDINWREIPKSLINNKEAVVGSVKKLLIESVKELTKCINGLGQSKQCKVAVLFSGGVDSTLIARMLDLVLPDSQQIDLINLAFRQDAPDREAGKISYQQLRILNPNRKYNLIFLDHTLGDVQNIQKDLMQVIYPKTTHMDFNIAAALNLASNVTPKIVFTGLGADQIFSGYSRYRIAFKRGAYDQLLNEMIFDMERLWIRNLGRDDRSIGSRGKEVRYPFLYLPLWRYLRSVDLSTITQGNGQKMLLRKVALDFGLIKASTFKKKAIQFGTRLAKLSNVKSFGSNRKAKGNSEYQ